MRYLSELSNDELLRVFEENSLLQERILQKYEEDVMDDVFEIITVLKRSLEDWNIGFSNYNFIKIDDYFDFVDCIRDIVDYFGFLDDKDQQYLEDLEKRVKNYKEYEYYDDEDGTIELNLCDEIEHILLPKVISVFNQITDIPNDEELREHFIEDCLYERFDNIDHFSIDDNYTLYEHVEYEKSYK
jgi:hypothetical protein